MVVFFLGVGFFHGRFPARFRGSLPPTQGSKETFSKKSSHGSIPWKLEASTVLDTSTESSASFLSFDGDDDDDGDGDGDGNGDIVCC